MNSKSNMMLDFHGSSVAQARSALDYYLQLSVDIGLQELRVVTGRGNHVNARGERGTLYHDLPQYLTQSPFKDRVLKCEARDGHYVLRLKTNGITSQNEAHETSAFDAFLKSQLPILREGANSNHPIFMMLYAEILEKGQYGEAQNFPKAASLYGKAAELGLPPAMHEYGRCYLHGVGVKQSDAEAVKWVEKAHNIGYPPSTESLAAWKHTGLPNYPANEAEGLQLYQLAIQQGSTKAMRLIATLHLEAKRFSESFKLYKQAADLGDVIAQYNTGVNYLYGQGVDQDQHQAYRYLALAAQGGDADAQFQMGLKMLKDDQLKYQDAGLQLLALAAQGGSSQACRLLSASTATQNDTHYLERSAQLGNIVDQLRLDALKDNNHQPINAERLRFQDVLPYFERLTDTAIKQLHAESKFIILDLVLLHGAAAKKRRAYELITSMADQKCTLSIRRQVYFYEKGDGLLKIKKSPKKAIELLQHCSDLGDVIATMMLAKRYLKRTNDCAAFKEALILLTLASKQHYPPAFYQLGLLHEQKMMADSSEKKAHCYYSLAIECERKIKGGPYAKFGPLDEHASIIALAQQGKKRTDPKPREMPRTRLRLLTSPPASPQQAPEPLQVQAPQESSDTTPFYSFFNNRNAAIAASTLAVLAVVTCLK